MTKYQRKYKATDNRGLLNLNLFKYDKIRD